MYFSRSLSLFLRLFSSTFNCSFMRIAVLNICIFMNGLCVERNGSLSSASLFDCVYALFCLAFNKIRSLICRWHHCRRRFAFESISLCMCVPVCVCLCVCSVKIFIHYYYKCFLDYIAVAGKILSSLNFITM